MSPRTEWFLGLGAVFAIAIAGANCAAAGPAKASAYAIELARCREDAGRYDDYELCALAVDAKYGKVKR